MSKMFDKIIGQKTVKSILQTAIEASRVRKLSLGHVLLSGPAGVGKTTLADEVAKEIGSTCKVLFAPGLKKKDDLVAAVLNLEANDVLFIDEIHALPLKMAEVLYTAMEEFKMHVCIDTKTITVDTVPFTLIGATTAPGLVPKPLLSRFRINARLELYAVEDLALIAEQMAKKQNFNIASEAAMDIAKRSRGTARLVRNFVDRSIDATVSRNDKNALPFITINDTTAAFTMLGINADGLNGFEVDLLRKLSDQYNNKPVGVETLAMLMNEDLDSFKQNYEPYLIQKGYIAKTNEGRVLTQRGAEVVAMEA